MIITRDQHTIPQKPVVRSSGVVVRSWISSIEVKLKYLILFIIESSKTRTFQKPLALISLEPALHEFAQLRARRTRPAQGPLFTLTSFQQCALLHRHRPHRTNDRVGRGIKCRSNNSQDGRQAKRADKQMEKGILIQTRLKRIEHLQNHFNTITLLAMPA